MKQFRVTSEKGYYFNCKVFDTKQEMYDYYLKRCKRWGVDPEPLIFASMVSPYQRYKGEAMHKNIGESIFCRGRLGAGLTSHEMLHCSLSHERVIEENTTATFGEQCGEIEERLCYTLTEFMRQFNEQCHKYGMYD